MAIESRKIKNELAYYWSDMIYLNKFDSRMLKITKRENRENNIYYISYTKNKPKYNIDSINNLYFLIQDLYGTIEKIDGSRDRYLVIDKNIDINKQNIDFFNDLWNTIINKIKYLRKDDIMFDENEAIINNWNKIRFSSNVFMPNDILINFNSLTIVINYVIEKNGKFIPEIYINEGLFEKV